MIFVPKCIVSKVMAPTHTYQMVNCPVPMVQNHCMRKTLWDGHLEVAREKVDYFKNKITLKITKIINKDDN